MQRVYLLTGGPGTGKTRLIKESIAGLPARAGGFYTEEIRQEGVRLGFKLVTLVGAEAVLAHTRFSKLPRVGKYGVDIEALDRVGVPALLEAARDCDLVVVDEIGKMELLSPAFREAVTGILAGRKRVLGTIMRDAGPFTDDIKRRPGVNLVELTAVNRAEVSEGLHAWLQSILSEET